MNTQTHYFNDGVIRTERQPNGEFTAIDPENYEPGMPMGWGRDRWDAIVDLCEQMRERGLLADPED